ncbi:MAG: flagellar hook-length control protein FliK [Planctomycetes bacterium]|nr:flagellar hook-length control protein FliK [Planctomycetota bacterium]
MLDGTVVLQTSGGQLAARSELPLPRGEVLLFRAELGPEGWILRVVTPETRPPDSELRRALLQYVAYARPLGDALADLRSVMEAARNRPGGVPTEVQQLLAELEAHLLRPGADGTALREHVLRSGLWQEALLSRLGREPLAARAEAQKLQRDLKSRLIGLLEQLPDGELREAVQETLRSIEAEQLTQLARRERGEALHLDLPFLDGDAWRNAHLRVERRLGPGKGREEAPTEQSPKRALLGVEFSRLGPLSIDIALWGQQVQLRLHATSETAAARIREAQAELVAAIEKSGLRAQASVGLVPARQVAPALSAPSPALLAEQPLMDLSG